MSDSNPKKPVLRVFVSATSSDLGSLRKVVIDALHRIGCLPVEQTLFEPDYRSIELVLRHKISECDAVLHFVGNRYGAEPDPLSLPDGVPRRSYTQMEYFIAKKLKKKLFVFLCKDDFPFDACHPEDPEKTELQHLYREKIKKSKEKREYINSKEDCTKKILSLQIQFEELLKNLGKQNKKLVSLLCVFSLIASGLLYMTFGISKEVSDINRKTATNLTSIESRLVQMLDSNILEKVAEKSQVDPGVIRLALAQFKALEDETTLLEFSDNLLVDGRDEVAIPLLKFAVEEAISGSTNDYVFIAESLFRIGQETRRKLEKKINHESRDELKSLAKDAFQNTQRAVDAYLAIPKGNRSKESLFSYKIQLEYARSAGNLCAYANTSEAKDIFKRAITLLEKVNEPEAFSTEQQFNLLNRRARLFSEYSYYLESDEEKDALVSAISLAGEAQAIVKKNGDSSLKSRANLLLYHLLYRMSNSATENERLAILSRVRSFEYDELDQNPSNIHNRVECLIIKSRMLLDRRSEVFPDGLEFLEDAVLDLEAVDKLLSLPTLDRSSQAYRDLRAKYLTEWVRSVSLGQNNQISLDDVINEIEYTKNYNIFDRVQMFVDYVRYLRSLPENRDEIIDQTNSVSLWIDRLMESRGREDRPRANLDLQIKKMKLIMFDERGFPGDTCRDIIGQYSSQKYPEACVEARLVLFWDKTRVNRFLARVGLSESIKKWDDKSLSDLIENLEETLRMCDRKVSPFQWGRINLNLAKVCAKFEPPLASKGISFAESALSVFSQKEFPYYHNEATKAVMILRSR